MRFALCLPRDLEPRFEGLAADHGHEISARYADASELASAIRSSQVGLALVATSPRYLSAELLSLADSRGARIIGVATTDADRRYGAALGLLELADAGSEWQVFERMLVGVGLEGVTPDDATGPRRMPVAPAAAGDGVVTNTAGPGRFSAPQPQVHPLPTSPLRPHPAPSADRSALIVVWGPGGAPGRTTTAITIASELASFGNRVVLVDADTHGAAIAPTLGLFDEAPGFAAACRLAAAERFTEEEFHRVAPVHRTRSGEFRVLTGIANASRWPELGADRIRSVLNALRDWNDVIVVDVAASLERDEELISDVTVPRRNAATLTALDEADQVLAVTTADPLGVARLLRALTELESIDGRGGHDDSAAPHPEPSRMAAPVTVVVNRLRSGALGIDAAGEVRRALRRLGGIEHAVLVPYDRAAYDAASLSATPLTDAAPRSAARRALRELVEQQLLPSAPGGAAVRRPWWTRKAASVNG